MDIKKFDELNFSDDFMFYKVMTNYEDICRRVVELCIGHKVSGIRYKGGQETMKVTPQGRGIRLDVYLEDDKNTIYDLEMQTVTDRDTGRRVRYYDSVMSVNSLESGKRFRELPDSYIVFICLFDPFGQGRAVYEFRKRDKTDHKLQLDDGSVDILINVYGDDSECSPEMRQFLSAVRGNANASGIGRDINNAVQEVKEHRQWREDYMLYEIKLMEHEEIGEAKRDRELIERWTMEGKSAEEISGLLARPLNEITDVIAALDRSCR